jgi:dihydrofolate reductase
VSSGVVKLITAVDESRGLADEDGIPWQGLIPGDAAYFRDQTATGTILMGFRTYQEFSQPLHDRDNFVLVRSRLRPLRPGFVGVDDLDDFLLSHSEEEIWVVGGAGLYEMTLSNATELFITQLDKSFACTKFFPPYREEFQLVSESDTATESEISYRFQVWHRSVERL